MRASTLQVDRVELASHAAQMCVRVHVPSCIESPFFAAPFITVFLVPVMLQATWTKSFLVALFGGKITAFSKNNHKWDVPFGTKKSA